MIALRHHLEQSAGLSQSNIAQRKALRIHRESLATPSAPAERRAESDGLISSVVGSREDLHAALGLVYDAYRATDLIEANPYRLRATKYHLLSTTNVFIARRAEELQATITLVRDGKFGLPMEDVYADEVAARRAAGVSVAEVSCLADIGHGQTNMLSVVVKVMSHMVQFAHRQGVDELLIAVHPHHVAFYERFIGFEIIGEQRTYSAVCDNPAVALRLDINAWPVRYPRGYQRFFGKRLSDQQLTAKRLSATTLAELRLIVEQTNPQGAYSTYEELSPLEPQAA